MDTRQEQLLKLIIERYLETAEPVGSKFLVESAGLGRSDATVRNEMRDLENQGYLTQPHTSAGRLPTACGYRYYVARVLAPVAPSKRIQEALRVIGRHERDRVRRAKSMGKFIAAELEGVVIIVWQTGSIYYTGISHLFAQPEFRDYARTLDISALFDECEERVAKLYDLVDEAEPTVLIGEENPLGHNCATVASRLNRERLFAMVGPLRMPYARGIGLLRYVADML